MSGNLIQSNATRIPLKDESVQLCCFSPPYWGLRKYKIRDIQFPDGYIGQLGLEPSIDLFLDHMMLVMEEVWRVLRDDGICFVNIGDSYATTNPVGNRTAIGKSGLNCFTQDYIPPGHKKDICSNGEKRQLSGIKPKSLCLIPQKFAIRCQEVGWIVRSEIIWHKCLSGGTILYAQTQKGEMPSTVKDLVRLNPDTVKLWNGKKWTQVLSWSQRKYPKVKYEIVLRNGQRIGCTANHRWETERGLLKTNRLEAGDVLSRCVLPQPSNPVTPEHLPDEIGWFAGIFLAEGSFGNNKTALQISSHVKESKRFEKLKVLADKYGGTCRWHEIGGKSSTINMYGPMLHAILRLYLNGKNAKGKHLSSNCWKRSNEFLKYVLQGYLDGDGHKRKNEWRLGFTENDNLAADLRTIGARLNLSVRLKRTVHVCNGKKYPGWHGSIREYKHRRVQDTQIIEIVKSRARKFWDIQVEDEPHLFSLASGILTHNSNPMPESCKDRPTKAHEQVWMLAKQEKYFFDQEAVAQPQAEYERARRLREKKQGHKTVYALQADGKTGQAPQSASGVCKNVQARHELAEKGTRNIRTVWTLSSESCPEAHFATWPSKLVEIIIRAGSSPKACEVCGAPWERIAEKTFIPQEDVSLERGIRCCPGQKPLDETDNRSGFPRGSSRTRTLSWQPTCGCDNKGLGKCVVADIFCGVGTTVLVAEKLGRAGVGLDLSGEYLWDIAKGKVEAPMQKELF